jgi:catechol 2,3-dioxygenase-like lactoylglutathione lyase family enzyme
LKQEVEEFEFMKRILILAVLFAMTVGVARAADAPKSDIVGVAHIGYYVSDMAKMRSYYEGFLGFQEPFAVKGPAGSDHVAYVKINDKQYFVFYAEPVTNHGFIHDVAFQSSDVQATRTFMIAAGLKPTEIEPDYAGDLAFSIIDEAGFTIEVVQYIAKSKTGLAKGKFMSANRISDHIDHIGLLTNDKQAAWDFYSNAFGFVKEGDGSKMSIPGTPDRFEIGFERKEGTIDRFHVKDHICLSIPDVPKVTAALSAKPEAKNFKEIENHSLGSGKNVAELYDLDGNRVEMMEPGKQM